MTTTTPSSDVETSVAEMNALAADITQAVDDGLKMPPGAYRRDDLFRQALSGIESLETLVRVLRTEVENLP
jgi:hypothetical protein